MYIYTQYMYIYKERKRARARAREIAKKGECEREPKTSSLQSNSTHACTVQRLHIPSSYICMDREVARARERKGEGKHNYHAIARMQSL